MNTAKLMLQACAVVFGLAASSSAATLFTAPVESGQGQVPDMMHCSVLNISSAPITVTMDGMNYKGDVVDTSGALTVGPDEGPTRGLSNGAVYCRLTVSTSAKKVVAGAFYARFSDGQLVSYVPAQ